jgi:hypothetical protein
MKNKILIVSTLALAFASSIDANQATSQKGNIQVENIQNQEQNEKQVQNQNKDIQNQEQNEKQVQNQNKDIQNQEQNEKQVQNQEMGRTRTESSTFNKVASSIQEMLQINEENNEIKEQIRNIAQIHIQNHEKLETNLQVIQNRNSLVRFFIGPNYNEIKNANKLLEQNRERIEQLNQIKDQLSNQANAQILGQQIQNLKEANLEIENSLIATQKRFSLFGWAFKLLTNN